MPTPSAAKRLQDGLDWGANVVGVDARGVQQEPAALRLGIGSLGIDAGDIIQQGVQAGEPAPPPWSLRSGSRSRPARARAMPSGLARYFTPRPMRPRSRSASVCSN